MQYSVTTKCVNYKVRVNDSAVSPPGEQLKSTAMYGVADYLHVLHNLVAIHIIFFF